MFQYNLGKFHIKFIFQMFVRFNSEICLLLEKNPLKQYKGMDAWMRLVRNIIWDVKYVYTRVMNDFLRPIFQLKNKGLFIT